MPRETLESTPDIDTDQLRKIMDYTKPEGNIGRTAVGLATVLKMSKGSHLFDVAPIPPGYVEI